MASIFCDGACSGNGTAHAYGGWAWAYWPGIAYGEPKAFAAKKLVAGPGFHATNQRAELMALLEAVRFALTSQGPVTIYTDSTYALKCASVWGPAWKKKGWKRDSGEPLQNLDIIKPLVDLWNPKVPLVHVRGHQTGCGPLAQGNNWVDRAAVAAAKGDSIQSGDVIEHIVDTVQHKPVQQQQQKPQQPQPKSLSKTEQKKPIITATDVKQTDIRLWFAPV